MCIRDRCKPHELRFFLEEAAGISKYKDRRRETENRIARTHANLERLSDLREELHRQLMRLERQSKSAHKYTELREKERYKQTQIKVLRWRSLDEDIKTKSRKINNLELEKFKSNILFEAGPFGRIIDFVIPLVTLINPLILSAIQILFSSSQQALLNFESPVFL